MMITDHSYIVVNNTVVDETPLNPYPLPSPVGPLLADWEQQVLDALPNRQQLTAGSTLPVDLDVLASQLLSVSRRPPPIPLQPHLLPWWSLLLIGASLTVGLSVLGICSDSGDDVGSPEHITRGRDISRDEACREAREVSGEADEASAEVSVLNRPSVINNQDLHKRS
ncbi:hypothetical protein E2C01_030868 [Portunus trituberculatus]|uniref:Uncharacterized protein n=1 Tax=Portunus trituberculatus TaxID=210409 RepID=A0A5B7EYJ4_PORTR|nr:hypothetical protein [Portunus trituberculatus]